MRLLCVISAVMCLARGGSANINISSFGQLQASLSLPGQTFLIDQTLVVGSNISLDGQQCTLDAQGERSILVLLPEASAVISNLTFRNARNNAGNDEGSDGGAVTLKGHKDGGSRGTLTHCVFTENSKDEKIAALGGAVSIGINCRSTFLTCSFNSNNVKGDTHDGGGAVHDKGTTSNYSACIFEDNVAHGAFGGAVYMQQVQPFGVSGAFVFVNCVFQTNAAGRHSGGAIRILESTPGLLSTCTFRRNSAHGNAGGGIYFQDDGGHPPHPVDALDRAIRNCSFEANHGHEKGGAVCADRDKNIDWRKHMISFEHCSFKNNTVHRAGGALSFAIFSGTIISCTFSRNSATPTHQAKLYGGAIDGAQRAHMQNCLFESNTVRNEANGDGGGAVVDRDSDATGSASFLACTFTSNTYFKVESDTMYKTDKSGGGALRVSSGTWTLHECLFQSNFAQQNGGAVSVDSTGFDHGVNAVMSANAIASVNATACTFSHNACGGDGYVDNGGGALSIHTADTCVVHSCLFQGNTAGVDLEFPSRGSSGGAVYIQGLMALPSGLVAETTTTPFEMTVRFSTFTANNATMYGGAFFIDYALNTSGTQSNSLSIDSCLLQSNTARSGGALYAGSPGSRITLTESRILKNFAKRSGGGMHIRGDYVQVLDFVSCEFRGNRALVGSSVAWEDPALNPDGSNTLWKGPLNLTLLNMTDGGIGGLDIGSVPFFDNDSPPLQTWNAILHRDGKRLSQDEMMQSNAWCTEDLIRTERIAASGPNLRVRSSARYCHGIHESKWQPLSTWRWHARDGSKGFYSLTSNKDYQLTWHRINLTLQSRSTMKDYNHQVYGCTVQKRIRASNFEACAAVCPKGKVPQWSAPRTMRTGTLSNQATNRAAGIQEAYTLNLAVNCTDCPTGKVYFYDDALRTSFCNVVACPKGYFCSDGTKEPCPAGRFQDRDSSITCELCEPGLFAVRNATGGTLRCSKCSPGQYQGDYEKSLCLACPAGHVQRRSGMDLCDECEDGVTFQDGARQTVCKACGSCLAGYSISTKDVCTPSVGGRAKDFDMTNLTFCHACLPGRFGESPNQPKCDACPPGYVRSSLNASVACVMCGEGTYAASESLELCATCPAGHKQQFPGKSACFACSTGEFSEAGKAECAFCPEGFFKGAASACQNCDAGTYNFQTRQTTCKNCDQGEFQTAQGATICKTCAPGSYQDTTGGTTCNLCTSGTWSKDAGSEQCSKCDDEDVEYTEPFGATKCKRCSVNAVVRGLTCACKNRSPANVDEEDPTFSPGFFEVGFVNGTHPHATASKRDCNTEMGTLGCCRPCPVGGSCKDGRLYVNPGYWRLGDGGVDGAPPGTAVLKRCPTFEACPGVVKRDPVSNFTQDGNGSTLRWTRAESGPCRPGHAGIMCGECEAEWRLGRGNLCIPCGPESEQSQSPKILLGTLGSLVLLGVITGISTAPDRKKKAINTDKANDVVEDGSELSDNFDNAISVLPYIQRFAAMSTAFPQFDWPHFMHEVAAFCTLAYGSLTDILQIIDPCNLHMSFVERIAVQVGIIPWMFCLSMAAYGIAKLSRRRLKRRREDTLGKIRMSFTAAHDQNTRKKLKKLSIKAKKRLRFAMTTVAVRLLSILIFSVRFLYPGIGGAILQSFVCTRVGKTRLVLVADVSMTCFSSMWWRNIGVLATTAVFVVIFGVPIGLAAAVIRERRSWHRQLRKELAGKNRVVQQLFTRQTPLDRLKEKAHQTRIAHGRRAAEMLHTVLRRFIRLFKPRYWWWFIVEMLLSLVFIGILAIFTDLGVQVAVGGAAALLQLLLPARLLPYAKKLPNQIALVGGCQYYLLFLSGLAKILAKEASSDARKLQIARADTLIETVVACIVVGICAVVFHTFLALACSFTSWDRKRVSLSAVSVLTKRGRRGRKSRRRGRNRVVPLPRKKSTDTAITTSNVTPAADAEDECATYSAMLEALNRVHAPKWRVIEACPPALRQRYIQKWKELLPLHVEIVAVAMQAITRGFIERQRSSRLAPAMRKDRSNRLSVADIHGTSPAEQKAATLATESFPAAAATHGKHAMQSSKFAAMKMQVMARGALLGRVSKEGAELRQELERERTIRRSRLQSQIMDEAEAKRILEDDASVHAAHLESLEAEREQLRAGRQVRFLEKRWVAVLRKHTKNKNVLKLARPELVAVLQDFFHDIDSAADHTDDVDGMLCQLDLVHVLENMMGRGRASGATASAAEDTKKNHEIAETMIKTMLAAVQGGDGEHITEAHFVDFFVAIAERRSAKREMRERSKLGISNALGRVVAEAAGVEVERAGVEVERKEEAEGKGSPADDDVIQGLSGGE